jgi:hypothetical protein
LDEGIRTLAQSSKKTTVPKNYLALCGDSYAQGMGDWLLTCNTNKNPEFHSAHVINTLTGKDVISFGGSGAGSLRAVVAEPVSQFKFINASFLFKMEPPDAFIIYFYAGNDLYNNLRDISLRYEDEYDMEKIKDKEYFREFIEDVILKKDYVFREAESMGFVRNLYLAKLCLRLFRQVYRNVCNSVKKTEIVYDNFTDEKNASKPFFGSYNRAIVKGEEVEIPDLMQAAGLELTEQEMDLAVYVFEESLSFLKEYFPESKIFVVYVPATLGVYELSCEQVKVQSFLGRQIVFNTESVYENSDKVCSMIKKSAIDSGAYFIDPRPELREATSQQFVHGPIDWKHFNKRGYTVLGEVISKAIKNENI